MKNNILFLALVMLVLSCGNAQKSKTSDKITGVFSYTKGGAPAFKIKDTIINGKKRYSIYDYESKKKKNLIAYPYYDKNDTIVSKRNKNVKRNLKEKYINWEDWLYKKIRTTTKTGHHKKYELIFNRVKKGIVLENQFTEIYKTISNLFIEEGYKIKGYDNKMVTGFYVTKSFYEGMVQKETEVKILYKLSDI